MPDRKEKKESVKVNDPVGILALLTIRGDDYLFDINPLPASVKNAKIGQKVSVTVVWEGSRVIGIKNGSRIVHAKPY